MSRSVYASALHGLLVLLVTILEDEHTSATDVYIAAQSVEKLLLIDSTPLAYDPPQDGHAIRGLCDETIHRVLYDRRIQRGEAADACRSVVELLARY